MLVNACVRVLPRPALAVNSPHEKVRIEEKDDEADLDGGSQVGILRRVHLMILAFSDDSFEDGVYVGELAVDVEGFGDFVGAEEFVDFRVGFDELTEVEVILPGVHGVGLDELVGVLRGSCLRRRGRREADRRRRGRGWTRGSSAYELDRQAASQ